MLQLITGLNTSSFVDCVVLSNANALAVIAFALLFLRFVRDSQPVPAFLSVFELFILIYMHAVKIHHGS